MKTRGGYKSTQQCHTKKLKEGGRYCVNRRENEGGGGTQVGPNLSITIRSPFKGEMEGDTEEKGRAQNAVSRREGGGRVLLGFTAKERGLKLKTAMEVNGKLAGSTKTQIRTLQEKERCDRPAFVGFSKKIKKFTHPPWTLGSINKERARPTTHPCS